MHTKSSPSRLTPRLGTWEVLVAGVALVVAASTLVSDFTGFFSLGGAFVVALLIAWAINLLLGLSAADLSTAYPRAGALYEYARAVIGGNTGRFLGIALGLSFYGMFAFAASGETASGAFGLKALLHSDLPIELFIVALGVLAVIPNILGIRTTAWVSAALLLFMIGIRWFFGLAGFFGWGNTGAWSAANLDAGLGAFDLFGSGGVLMAGLALAIWSFVGIEFAASLAEEVREPKKAMPRGIVLGLIGILLTSLVMGLGVAGSEPVTEWQRIAAGVPAFGGEAPQLAVGLKMFGRIGYSLMALASVAATLGTLTVAFAAMPRILYSIARDGYLFGTAGKSIGRLHAKFQTPVAAIVVSFILYITPALFSSAVIDWLYSAAYCWLLLYAGYHLLALVNRIRHPQSEIAFAGRWFTAVPVVGIVATLGGLYYAFAGAHALYGFRALLMLGIVGLITSVSFALSKKKIVSPSGGKAVYQTLTFQDQPMKEHYHV